MKWLSILLTFTFISGVMVSAAQDTLQIKKFEVRGYIKDIQTLTFNKDFSELITGNYIHNRINFKYKPNTHFTAALENAQ